MKVCTEMKDLLRSLSDTEPGHRPELAEVAKVTNWTLRCLIIYMFIWTFEWVCIDPKFGLADLCIWKKVI